MKIVAKALVLDKANNVLLLRRSSSHPNFPDHLDLPGGEVEPGETSIHAAQREIEEETSLKVTLDELNLVYQKQISPDLLHIVYVAAIPQDKPAVELSWEHQGFEWRPYGELRAIPVPENVDKYHLTILEYLATL